MGGTGRYSFVSAAGPGFLLAAAAARLPAPMIQLGLLLSAGKLGLGWGLGGSLVAAIGVGSGIAAPLVGHLVDRWGAGRVLPVCLLLQVAAVTGLAIVVASAQTPLWLTLALAGLLGATNLQAGAIARVRWSRVLARQADLLPRAMAYEGAVDEATFVAGPLIAGLIVASLPAHTVLASFVVLVIACQVGFVFSARSDRRAVSPPSGGSVRLADVASIWPLLVVGVALGCGFGATQTALAGTITDPGLVGGIYACVGIGSATGGVLAGWSGAGWTTRRWLVTGAAVMLPASLVLAAAPGPAGSAAGALWLGTGIGAALVSCYSMLHRRGRQAVLTTLMTVVATAVTLGVSAGAAATGGLLDRHAGWAWLALLVGSLTGVVGAVAVRRLDS